jgi:hypothetical protein
LIEAAREIDLEYRDDPDFQPAAASSPGGAPVPVKAAPFSPAEAPDDPVSVKVGQPSGELDAHTKAVADKNPDADKAMAFAQVLDRGR